VQRNTLRLLLLDDVLQQDAVLAHLVLLLLEANAKVWIVVHAGFKLKQGR